MALLFAMLWWRVNTPEDHLSFGRIGGEQLPEHKND
jgi:hypothetical protein